MAREAGHGVVAGGDCLHMAARGDQELGVGIARDEPGEVRELRREIALR